jgi:hypothetical protein
MGKGGGEEFMIMFDFTSTELITEIAGANQTI